MNAQRTHPSDKGRKAASDRKRMLDLVRRALTRTGMLDWGVAVALVIGLFSATAFLTRGALPHQTDAELHVYRTAELNHLVRGGVRYPRWAANLYLGYGYPIFNYYAPFTYHLGSFITMLVPGIGIVTGTKAVFVLGLLLAAVGTYLLGRDLFGPLAGILAAASYTLSPYLLFIDPHGRGDLAEHFAVGLLPLAFYFLRRLILQPSPYALFGSVISLATVVFSHNLMGLLAGGLLLAYWLWSLFAHKQRQGSAWGLVAFGLAAGLIAFFWLPALAESAAVKLEVIGPGHFDFREHYVTLTELLAPSRLIDWGATGPRYRHNLGLGQWLLAVPSVWVLLKARGNRRSTASADAGFFILAALGLIFLMHPASVTVWELTPGMAYLQFPWRLLGAANLMLAVCAAAAVTLAQGARDRMMATGLGLIVVLATALPLLYPAPWPADFGGTTPRDIIEWETVSEALGTTSTGDFLPTTVDVIPSIAETLVQSYEQGGPVDKVNRATLPEGAQVEILSHGPTHDRFRVKTPEPFVLRLYTFYFPGWQAYLDGVPAEIELAHPEGFITVPTPRGDHTVTVRFEPTPVRELSWILSLGTLVALSVILLVWVNRREGGVVLPEDTLDLRNGLPLASLVILVLTVKVTFLDPQEWLHRNWRPGQAVPAEKTVGASFEGQAELLGYTLPKRVVRPGESFALVLYWRALTAMAQNYQSFVHVARPLNRTWGQEDHLNPGGLPTSRWPTDEYVWDEYQITVLPETPPGEYSLNVGLYLQRDGTRLKRYDEAGQLLGDGLVIDSITVTD